MPSTAPAEKWQTCKWQHKREEEETWEKHINSILYQASQFLWKPQPWMKSGGILLG
jgi:hypothetical protein